MSTAAKRYGWGAPTAEDGFDDGELGEKDWEIYEGAGHAGAGTRSRRAVSVREGALRIEGKANGMTGGVAWKPGAQKRGRWEARVRLSRGCACYHPVVMLWPVDGGGGTAPKDGGGEINYMETIDDGLRQGTDFYLHYGPKESDSKMDAHVEADMREWHNFAVEVSDQGISGFIDGKRWFPTDEQGPVPQAALPPGEMGQTIQLDWVPGHRERTAQGLNNDDLVSMEVDWIKMYGM